MRDVEGRLLEQIQADLGSDGLPLLDAAPALRSDPVFREQFDRTLDTVSAALDHLEAHDVPVSGQMIIGTRHPARTILRHIDRTGMHLVVMGAPAKRRMGDWSWSNEPYRVARKARVPVVLVTTEAQE